IELLDEHERHQILSVWNDTAHTLDTDATLVSLFEAQAAATPDRVAVEFEGTTLSYGQFAAEVNRLARWLIGQDVGPESLVGIAMARSIDLLIAVHAVVTAGGAYVPVDPDHPAERVGYILGNARPVCVLTSGSDLEITDTVWQVRIDELDLTGYRDAPVTDSERLRPLTP
ncbi:AMP-binding protein, partial [Nocardia araoensis]|uniref:AMP-binding protein n=1 Tax=Nocardia araoensis TaxID=228600 RepID=UPI000585AEF4